MRRVIAASLVAVGVCAAGGAILVQAGGEQAAKPGAAQAPAVQRSWYTVNVVTLKPEMVPEWIEFQKSQVMPMQQRGGVKDRDVWQSGAPFGEGFTYAIVAPIAKFADFDQPPLAIRVLGSDGGRAFQEKNRKLVASAVTYGVQDRAELSIAPAPAAKFVGAILQDVTVVGGHADQYEAYVKNDLLPVLKKGNVPGYLVSRTVFGGNANEYHTVQLFDSFGEIDKGPVAMRVLGAAPAQALTAKVAPHIASINRTLIRYVPDLSFHGRPGT